MKVCYVTHAPNLTGASRSLLDLLAGLNRDEVEPVVLLSKHGPIEEKLRQLDVTYKIIPYVTAVKSKNTLKNLLKQMIETVPIPKIARFLKTEQIDLVHNNSFIVGVGMEAAKRHNIPYVCHLRELIQEDHKMEFFDEVRQNSLLQGADTAIAISQFVAAKYVPLAPNTKFTLLHNGLNATNYLEEGKRVLDSNILNILFTGRFAPGKGQLEAVKAVECLRTHGVDNFTLKFVGGVGDEVYAKQVRDYVAQHELHQVEFIEFTDDLRGLRRKSDIDLVCSSAEAMGRVTIESMLAGCLTIGADAGATPELIQDGKTGLLYQLGDPEDLADKILYAVQHKEEMQAIARQGQTYAKENFDNKVYAQKITQLYREILDKRKTQ